MKRKITSLLTMAITIFSYSLDALADGLTTSDSYYIQNVESGLFMCGANNWGTKGSVSVQGDMFKLVGSEGIYKLQDQSVSVANKNLGANLFTDNAGIDWTISPVEGEEGVYTIYGNAEVGAGYIAQTAEKGYHIGFALGTTSSVTDASKWRFLTKEQASDLITKATPSNPVDASFLISCPNFSRNMNGNAWVVDASNKNMSGGLDENRCAEHWQSAFTVSQTISVPNGKYKLSAQAALTDYANLYDGANYPVVYATSGSNEVSVPFMNMEEGDRGSNMSTLSASFSGGKYVVETDIINVLDGKLTIGVKGTRTNTWCIYDNFQLVCVGYNSGFDATAYKESLSKVVESANALLTSKMSTTAKTNLETAITENNKDYDSAQGYTAAEGAINAAIANANASIAVYAEVLSNISKSSTLDASGQMSFDSDENVIAVKAAYDNGTLETLEDANITSLKNAFVTAVCAQKTNGADMTGAIVNNDFENCANNNFPGWTIEAPNGGNTWKNGAHNVEYWQSAAVNGSFDYYQTITGLPAGTYKLTARMWNSTNTEAGAEFAPTSGVYGTTDAGTFYGLVTEDTDADNMKEYSTENFLVENGTLRLGVKNSTTMAARWFGVDWIKLTLVDYGIGLGSYAALLESHVTEAKNLSKNAMSAVVFEKLDKAIKDNDGVTYSTTSEYSNAINNVFEAIEEAKSSVKVYADIYSYIGKGDNLDENGKAQFNGDALVSELLASYNNGTVEALTEEQKTALTATYVAAVRAQTSEGSDFTAVIVNPSFETGTTEGWTVGSSSDTGARDNNNATYTMSGADGKWVFNTWATGLPITQTISDIPNGTYKLKAVVASDNVNTVFITGNSERIGANSENKSIGKEVELEFYVSENTATIGAIGGKGSDYLEDGGDWYKVDNFRLIYVNDKVPAPGLGTATFSGSDSDDIKLVITFDNYSNQLAATSPENKYVINIKINDVDYSNTCSADKGAVIAYEFSAVETYTVVIPDGGIKLVNAMDEVIAETKGTIKETFSRYSESFSNADFSFGTPVEGTIRTYAKDIASSKEQSGMLSIPGWSFTVGGDAHAAGIFEYGSNAGLGDPNHKAPAEGPDGTNGYGLGVLGVWSASSFYTQTIRLEAGSYMVQIPTYNAGGGDNVSNLTGVIINGKSTYSKTREFKVGVWTTQTVEFTLTSTTAVTVSLGYTSLNKGSGSCPHLFYDRVEIFSNEDIEKAKLASAKADALAAVSVLNPIGDGIFRYDGDEISAAIAAINSSKTIEDVKAVAIPEMKLPDADKPYQIALNSSGKFMSINGADGVKLSNFAQPLYIREAKGGYAISDGTMSLAYQGGNTWSLVGAANPSTMVITPIADTYTIKSVNGYIGADSDEAGSSVFGNKDAHNWVISEYEPTEISLSDALMIEAYDHIVADNITINTAVNGTTALINNGSVTANSMTVNVEVPNNEWSFMIMPCDVPVADFKNTQPDTQWKIYNYDGVARANGDFNNVWAAVSETSNITKGNGFIFQSRRGEEATSVFSFTTTDETAIANVFTKDDVNISLAENKSGYACNSGWNLVGNPYMAFFNKSQMSTTAPITVWEGNNYVTYTSDDSYVLSPLQAFFIQTAESAELKFAKGGRQLTAAVSSDANARRVSAIDRNLYNITLSDGNFTDKTRFVINEYASLNYEIGSDASKFMSENASVPQIFTIEDNVMYSVNERPMSNGIINLGVRVAAPGTYTISVGSLASAVVLEDKLTGEMVVLNDESDSYTFTVAEAGTLVGRFVIRASEDATAISDIAVAGNAETIYTLQGVKVSKNAVKRGIYLMDGKKVMIK